MEKAPLAVDEARAIDAGRGDGSPAPRTFFSSHRRTRAAAASGPDAGSVGIFPIRISPSSVTSPSLISVPPMSTPSTRFMRFLSSEKPRGLLDHDVRSHYEDRVEGVRPRRAS